MKKGIKVIIALAGVAGAGATGLYARRRHLNKQMEKEFIEDMDEEEEENSEEEWGDLFDDLDEEICPEDLDLKAQYPIFGDEKKLLPGEKKFLDEFLDGVQAITTIMNDELDSIDLLARTSNMPCKIKCDKIRDLCKEAHENCHLISEITDDVLKVLRKEYCWEYRDYINAEIAKMEQEGIKHE